MSNENQTKHSCNSKKGIITFWTIVLIVVLFFFLKNAGFLTSVYLSALLTWPLILFIISIICLIHKEWVFGIISLAAAKFFWIPKLLAADPDLFPCLSADGFVQHYWYLLVAFIAVVIILQHIFGKEKRWEKHGCKKYHSNFQETKDGYLRSSIVFSNNEKIYLNENFKGGKFETVFGAQEIDLRKCTIPAGEKAYLEISTVFGSCIIWIPEDWKVKINTKSVFSSLENKRMQNIENGDATLIINGESVFSSLEIRS
ncbi:MAG: cell wall-active antibiotics response protein [Bacteroidetes bacterium]|nr:cell wall-active antibiotics response protein [Bacteroidota bacterium]MCL1968631.1 cell wall-active antibiotics response protein [Bacteroidota bacterium]